MSLPNRSVRRSAFGVPGDWRGAALSRAQGPRTFFPVRGRPKYCGRQATPANCPARGFVSRSVRVIDFAPRNELRIWTVRGSLLLKKICGRIRVEQKSVRSDGYDLKRPARRSLPESKRRGEVWLPSRRPERQTPNPERQTRNGELLGTFTAGTRRAKTV
jgi:hypothetical protein